MVALVLEFFDGLTKGRLQLADLTKYELRKPEKDRSIDAALSQIVNYLFYVGGKAVIFGRSYDQITFAVDAEIVRSPIVYSVCFNALFDHAAQFCVVSRLLNLSTHQQ